MEGNIYMYNFYGKEIDSKILILSKGASCKYCVQLDMFLTMALDNQYADKVSKVLEEEDQEFYDLVVKEENFLQAPMIINLETKESSTGFNPGEVLRILQSA